MAAILNSAILDSDFCHLMEFRHLVIISQDSLKNILPPLLLWLKLFQSDSNSFILHLSWWWCPSWILPSWIPASWIQPSQFFLSTKLILAKIGSHHLHKKNFTHTSFSQHLHKNLHSFILTQLDDDSHLEFCHVGFRHCHVRFRHLVIFSQIHSKTLSLHSDSDSN